LTGIAYTVSWVDDLFGIDPADDNVDVTVSFANGERYTATFFTPQNVASLMEKYAETGECAHGLYVWATHMIFVATLTRENVERCIADLLETGEFMPAFEGPFVD
jgi:hypothetical protein